MYGDRREYTSPHTEAVLVPSFLRGSNKMLQYDGIKWTGANGEISVNRSSKDHKCMDLVDGSWTARPLIL
jgi:hypothetical protein